MSYSIRLVHGVFLMAHWVNKFQIKCPRAAYRHESTSYIARDTMYFGRYFPALLVEPLVNSVTRASLMQPDFAGTHLAIWHGFNAPLVMSIIALAGGTLFYFALAKMA